jgi:uncharacterized protein (TIGR02145 family)
MIRTNWISSIISLLMFVIVLSECTKKESVVVPTVSTSSITNIASTAANSGGNVTSDGGGTVIARGVCWSAAASPSISLETKTLDGSGTGSFTSSIIGLAASTQYHIRAYATNSAGTAYGSDVVFTTAPLPILIPTITTATVSSISSTTATSGGSISSDGGGTISARGVCWSMNSNPTIDLTTKTADGSGTGDFTSNLTGLLPNTQYHIRAYATNTAGTAYGSDIVFNTIPAVTVPTITTLSVTSVTSTAANSGGNITSDGGATVTSRGVCWSINPDPTIDLPSKTSEGTGAGSFSSSLTGLTAATKYYIRAYASNSVGTAYGQQLTFTTRGTVKDIEGNLYNTVFIGDQQWMAENLKTTRFNDSTSIPFVNNTTWGSLTTPAYTWYNNTPSYGDTYGALYNWYSVSTGKLCPTGWHVPTDAEWTILTTYLGGVNIAGDKLKEAGTTHWLFDINNHATNETGFTGLPGGMRATDNAFYYIVMLGRWWSSTENSQNTTGVWYRGLEYTSGRVVVTYEWKQTGYSVRCIKDN